VVRNMQACCMTCRQASLSHQTYEFHDEKHVDSTIKHSRDLIFVDLCYLAVLSQFYHGTIKSWQPSFGFKRPREGSGLLGDLGW
jgi:hypothetical protein